MQRVPESLVRGLPILAGLVALWATLGHGFAFDDPMAIVTNPLLDGSRSWLDALRSDFWGERAGFEHIASWRPLTLWSLRLDMLIGAGQPMSFHLTNGLLHLLIVASAVFTGVRLAWSPMARLWLGLSVALTPAFAEALASIVGRGDLLAALFGLWGLLLIRARPGLALASLALALLAKETAVVYALSAGAWALATNRRGLCVALALLGGGWYLTRASVVGHLGGAIPPIDNPLVAMSFDERFLAGMGVVGRYVSWSLGGQPVPADLAAGVTHGAGFALLGALSLMGLFVAAYLAYRARSSALLWASLALSALLLLSNLVFVLPTPAAGRLAYHPALGLCLLVAAALSAIPRGHRALRVAYGLAFALLILGGLSGVQTMAAWSDDTTLFEASVAAEPGSARANTNLAKRYMEAGRYEEARVHLRHALTRAPDYPLALLNLSALLERLSPGGKEAWELAQRAVTQSTQPAKALSNLCALALQRQHLEASVVLGHCQVAHEALPQVPEVLTNLARAYQRSGALTEAERVFDAARAQHPDAPFVLGHWIGFLVQSGRTGEAVQAQRQVAARADAPPSARSNLVALLLKLGGERKSLGNHSAACELAREARALAPGIQAVQSRAQALCE